VPGPDSAAASSPEPAGASGEAYVEAYVEGDGAEELPDVAGLAPVRSLAQLRSGAGGADPGATAARTPRPQLAPREALRRYWGFDDFRPLQAEAVAAAMAGRDSLIVLPTGGGKSLCYQVPAACVGGLVLVVSPLIALMDDQVAAAREAGLTAGALHSNLPESERVAVRRQLALGTLDLLYVSPERLVVADLGADIGSRLRLFAVDEAHCVSHWGHDFRPEYRQLAPLFQRFAHVPRMALTATATPQVQDDIRAQLGLRDPLRLVGHVDRPNLVYRALPRQKGTQQVLDVVRRHAGEGGIVYAQTRREVERLAEALKEAGIQAAAYHAGLDPSVRARVQADFVNERLAVVTATIAFGMGIDRSDVRFVIHANAPKSIEHYQQEAGRAGRDGEPAECVLLFSAADLVTHRSLALKDGPLSPDRRRALDRQLADVGRFAVSPLCRHRLLTEHFGQDYSPPAAEGCGACDVCLGETRELPVDEALVVAQKIISAVWRTGGRFGAGHVVEVLVGKANERATRLGHDQLAVFGMLRDAGEGAVRAWIDQLVVQDLLAITEERDYPLLTLTPEGKALCRGEGSVRLGAALPPSKGGSRSKRSRAAAPAGTTAVDQGLFERLRRLRRLLAEAQRVPPYVIFTDATLRELSSARPSTLDALLEVKGVGERQRKRYGPAFLAVIAGRDPEELAAG
jgi:ATP-dependent DNA helicase RecQ